MLKTLPAVAALAIASALLIPTVSHAASADAVSVSYADLNLGAAKGRTALERRIAFAARTVCAVGQSQELAAMGAANDCQDAAIARTRPAFDAAVNAARRGNVTVLDAAALIVSAQ